MMSTILDLPTDILLSIRDSVTRLACSATDPSDGLITHIALSRTCRQLRELYTFSSHEAEDAFWKDACATAGFGRPLLHHEDYDEPCDEPPLSWRDLTLILVTHRDVCEIRSCKEASAWLGPQRASTGSQKRPPVTFHPLFYYLHFCPSTHALDTPSILFTQLPTVPGGRLQAYAPLAGHARASCAFATSPPVRTISLVRPGGTGEDDEDEGEDVIATVCNPDGCTLLDVNRLLAETLPRSTENASTVMAHYHSLIEAYRSPDCSFAQTLRTGHHRGFLRDHSYPYLDGSPLPEEACDLTKADESGTEAITLRCSNGPRRLSRAGFYVRELFKA